MSTNISARDVAQTEGRSMSDSDVNARLNAMEAELRRIADGFELLIRLDERVMGLVQGQTSLFERVNKLERQVVPNTMTLEGFAKMWWLVAAAFLAFAFNVARDYTARPAVVAPASQQSDRQHSLPTTDGR